MFKKKKFKLFTGLAALIICICSFIVIATCDMTYIGEKRPGEGNDPFPGYELVNYNDKTPPIIKGGSTFWIEGDYTAPYDIELEKVYPVNTCLLFLYTYRKGNDVFFDYSPLPPTYNEVKGGYYLDTESQSRRALFKMILIWDETNYYFLAKTKIDEPWAHLQYQDISDFNPIINDFYEYLSIDGYEDNNITTITLPAGLYLIQISGAGGGGGWGYTTGYANTSYSLFNFRNVREDFTFNCFEPSSGGNAGKVNEILSLNKETTFIIYTGSEGRPAPPPSINGLAYAWGVNNSFSGLSLNRGLISGGGGGGGGSGSFIFSEEGYFLCAGGGGGGSGASYVIPGGAGGAGGVISGGAGGGGAYGYFTKPANIPATSSGMTGIPAVNFSGSDYERIYHGGEGGGYNYGLGGRTESNFINNGGSPDTLIYLPALTYGFEGIGHSMSANISSGHGGQTPAIISNAFIPWHPMYLNTNNANGKGADTNAPNPSVYLNSSGNASSTSNQVYYALAPGAPVIGNNGHPGGNNRNALQGNGAAGGTPISLDNNLTLPLGGEPGYIRIYRFNYDF